MKLDWKKQKGLLPAIVQDAANGTVLMLGYMDRQALAKTQKTGKVVFFSRSKGRLWMKGESSGHVLHLRSIYYDCDGDALLIKATPVGPTCHTGALSCFDGSGPLDFLQQLDSVIAQRLKEKPKDSYIAGLAKRGLDRIAQKVGEEAVETVIAAKNNNTTVLLEEASDLVFHLMVLLRAKGRSLADVSVLLRKRHK